VAASAGLFGVTSSLRGRRLLARVALPVKAGIRIPGLVTVAALTAALLIPAPLSGDALTLEGAVFAGSMYLPTYPCGGGLPTLSSTTITNFPCATTVSDFVDTPLGTSSGVNDVTGTSGAGSLQLTNVTYDWICNGLPEFEPVPNLSAASGNYSAPGTSGVFQWAVVGLAGVVNFNPVNGAPGGNGAVVLAPVPPLNGSCLTGPAPQTADLFITALFA
jgi:hypothetical protein